MNLLITFIILQILDGVLTYIGVSTHSIQGEGNPLLSYLMVQYGVINALIIGKLFALLCGISIFILCKHYKVIFICLNTVYFSLAVIPWLIILSIYQ
jgi:hypothetical protein